MRLIIVSGRSGSGKSTALDVLEDNGFYCIDNLPAGLLPDLAERALLQTELLHPQVAVSVDARNLPSQLKRFPELLDEVRARHIQCDVLYLDATGEPSALEDTLATAEWLIGAGKVRQVNLRFAAMASYYLFEPEFCNPASGWEKGQVEKNVQDARRRLWQRMSAFPDIGTLNAWLEQQCIAQWGQIQHGTLPGTVADVHAAEIASLMPPGKAFDGFVEHTKRVSPTCLVHFERNRYSVPASFANRPVSLRVYPERVVVAAEGQIVCEHRRVIDRSHDRPGQTIYDWRHYLAVVQRKPGALRNGAPFAELPDAFRALQQYLLKKPGGDREMVDILALVLQHDEQAVLSAVDMALKSGVPTKMHVLNLLHRLVDGKSFTPPTIDAPQALTLVNEPKANVERYDALRKTEARHAS